VGKEILVGYDVHVDAVAGWLGSYGGEDSPTDISRGLFAGEVGVPRLLKMLGSHGIKATWFVPGHSIETFPEEIAKVARAGHEIGLHGYSHENPTAMSPSQEEAVLVKSKKLVETVQGRPPVGYCAPWSELSTSTVKLLLKHDIKYDHSLMHRDFQPYYVRVGDRWTKIDLSKPAKSWMKPLKRGRETKLVEIPISWNVDDLPPLMFVKANGGGGYSSPHDIERIWMDQFDWVYREYDSAVFPMTIHPDVSGRPHVLLMHERIIKHINRFKGVRWATEEEMAREFVEKNRSIGA
jgi:peptidoglycan/xylan/chitin deacetylase (PgdA/CDA1 family)